MQKVSFKPSTFEYPLPVVLITSGDEKINNVMTVAWTGIINSEPPMTYVSIRKERYSYNLIKENMEFCINLVSKDLTYATDYCGVKSGKTEDKFKSMNLTRQKATKIKCPMIEQSPVNIECKVRKIEELGSHDMFIADIVAVNVSEKYIDKNGKFDIELCNLITYVHGMYYEIGKKIGKFGFSVKKS